MSEQSIIRDKVRVQLRAYLLDEFTKMLHEEIDKHNETGRAIVFVIDDRNFDIRTNVEVKYTQLGWFQDNDTETIKSINTSGNLFIEEEFIATFKIRFTEKRGFSGVDKMVKAATMAIESSTPNNEPNNKRLSVKRIMSEIYDSQVGSVTQDPRVIEIVNSLTSMNYSKKKSLNAARTVAKRHPDVHDIGALVDEAMQELANEDNL